MAKKRAAWYFITIEECPVCGSCSQYRERRYGRRPKQWTSRHGYKQYACSSHWM